MPTQKAAEQTSENAFQSGRRKIIPAVLLYARRGSKLLMIHKSDSGDGWHQGKWNGLGGKCEIDESPLQAAKREFHEEAGVDLPETAFKPLGVLQFPNFKPHRSEDWMVFVFQVEFSKGEAQKSCDEGELHWVEIAELAKLPLWEGDKEFIPWVAQGRSFVGTFWYDGKRLDRHWLSPL